MRTSRTARCSACSIRIGRRIRRRCIPPPRRRMSGVRIPASGIGAWKPTSLWRRDSSYPKGQLQKFEKVPQHTVEAVSGCVAQLEIPAPEWLTRLPSDIRAALDVFTGYILLDALIANQDRHHGHWGAIRLQGEKTLRLAPSFDHGASLARNITDEERV